MGPIWGRQDPGGPHVGPMNFVIWAGSWRQASRVNCHAQFISHCCGIIFIEHVFNCCYLVSYHGHIMPYPVLLPGRHQAIIETSAGILSMEPLGTNFSEMLINMYAFSFTKMHLKMSYGKWRPLCPGLSVISLNVLLSLALILMSIFTAGFIVIFL